MSITAYKVEAVGHDRTGEDYGYVNIMYRYGNKQSCPRPDQCEKLEVMWADESVYGPPAPGSKVGDFIKTWLMGSWDCGVFTHREIAQRLMDTFTGLKLKELAWFENPREKALKNGKLCGDNIWRQIVTLEDAMKLGFDLVDIDEIRSENSLDEYANLYGCTFVKAGERAFDYNTILGCGVDGYMPDAWPDWNPFAPRPLGNRPVWVSQPCRVASSAR